MRERKGIVPTPSMRTRTVTRDGLGIYEAECPRCGVWGEVDDDQWNGRVSIDCPTEGCPFHETIDLHAEFVVVLTQSGDKATAGQEDV